MRLTSLILFTISFCNTGFNQTINSLFRIQIKADEIVHSQINSKIYFSHFFDDDICILNPEQKYVEECITLPINVSNLALNSIETHLYALTFPNDKICRIDLDTKEIDLTITLPIDPVSGQFRATDIICPSSNPNQLLVLANATSFPKTYAIFLYENGQLRSQLNDFEDVGPDTFIDNEISPCIYAYSYEENSRYLTKFVIVGSQIRIDREFTPFITRLRELCYIDEKLLFTGSGAIWDLSGPNLGFFQDENVSAVSFVPDDIQYASSSNNKLFSLQNFNLGGSQGQALLFSEINLETFGITGSVQLDIPDAPFSFINLDNDRDFVFHTSDEIIFFSDCEFRVDTSKLILEPITSCPNTPIEITAPEGFDNYVWSTGQLGRTILVEENYEGPIYFAVTNENGCVSKSSNPIFIDFEPTLPRPFIEIDNFDSEYCKGDTVVLTANNNSDNSILDDFIWSTGETTKSITVTQTSEVYVKSRDENGCLSVQSNTRDLFFLEDSIPVQPLVMILGDTTTSCREPITLIAPPDFTIYRWSSGPTTQSLEALMDNFYTVRVGNSFDCLSTESEPIFVEASDMPAQPIVQVSGNFLGSSSSIGNQWYLNNELIDGATEQFFMPEESGIYTVQVTVEDCPSLFSEQIDFVFVSTIESELQQELKVYPNPASNRLLIKGLSIASNLEKIVLYNTIGMEMLSIKVIESGNIQEIDTELLASGIYTLIVINQNGNVEAERRIVRL